MNELSKYRYEDMSNDLEKYRQTLFNDLEIFLNDRVTLEKETYDNIDDEDRHDLHDIINAIVRLKWESDYDGYSPVDVNLVDTTQYYCRSTYIPHKPTMQDLRTISGGIETLSNDLAYVSRKIEFGNI